MSGFQLNRAVLALLVSGSMLAMPSQSHAIFHKGCKSCGTPAGAAPTVAPYYSGYAPAATTCSPCQQQTCNYVPQTCYRTVFQQVPVTAFQPVAGCDPCGNRTTTFRPVTTYVTQARLVPYTAYRQVFAPTVSYAPVASGCATGNCSSGVTYASPVTSSAPASCCGGASAPSYATPMAAPAMPAASPYVSPSPAYPANTYPAPSSSTLGVPGSNVPSLNNTPTPAAPNNSSVPNTFREGGSVTEPESRLRPIPKASNEQGHNHNAPANTNTRTNSTLQPRLLDTQDRTTALPMNRSAIIPVAATQPLDNDGWRPARN